MIGTGRRSASLSTREELIAEIERQVRTLGLTEDDVAEVVERLKQTSTPVLRDIYRKQSVEMARRIAEQVSNQFGSKSNRAAGARCDGVDESESRCPSGPGGAR